MCIRDSNEIYGEYLINAQGEDVVAGTRTPQYITKRSRLKSNNKEISLEESMPKRFKELKKILKLSMKALREKTRG